MIDITVAWANTEKSVLLVTYESEVWTWDSVLDSLRLQRSMIEEAQGIVDTVIDMRKARVWPKAGSSFKVFHQAGELRHARQRYTVVVGLNGVVEMMSNPMLRLYEDRKRDVYFVNTIEDSQMVLSQLASQNPQP
jgi:GTP:adenosylcobinamide-phosphate guanylyltransferase